MEKRRTLSELADDYLEAAELQTRLIGTNREKLNLSRKKRDRLEELRLKRLLCLLYRQRREVLEIAAVLKNYYQFSSPATRKEAGAA